MTTQHDERAELVRWLELEAIPHRPSSHSRKMLLKAAALLEADANGGEAVARVVRNGATVRLEWASADAAHNAKPGELFARPQQAAQVPQGWQAVASDVSSRVIETLAEMALAPVLSKQLPESNRSLEYIDRDLVVKSIQQIRRAVSELAEYTRLSAAHGIGKDQAPVGINGLTEAETAASASVMGLTRKDGS